MNKGYKNISVSIGTLREADLIEAFSEFLLAADKVAYKEITEEYPELLDVASSGEWDLLEELLEVDEASDLIDSLISALNELAADGYYFGAHIGDGAYFGFWEVDEIDSDESGICIEFSKRELKVVVELIESELDSRDSVYKNNNYYLTGGEVVCLETLLSKILNSY